MTDQTPAARLRATRDRLKITRPQLAAKMGVGQSTIRAHENGQNNIQPAVAELYAKELGITPSWLLYGEGPPPAVGTPTESKIPVVGRLRPGYFADAPFDPVTPHLSLTIPGNNIDGLKAYLNEGATEGHVSYVICAPWYGEALYLVDEVVIRKAEGSLAEVDTWKVGAEPGHFVFYKGDSQARAHEILKVQAPVASHIGAGQRFWVLGLVVGRLDFLSPHRIRSFRWPSSADEADTA